MTYHLAKIDWQRDQLTSEALRNHLFHGNKVPFWNYDAAQLTFGVEIEYFIGRRHNGGTFTLAGKSDYLNVIAELSKNHAYQDKNSHFQPGRVSKDTERGFIAIKPDYAWHILEISLPPRGRTSDLKSLLDQTIQEVDECLRTFGLQRIDISCLPDVPNGLELVELERLSGHVDALKDIKSKSPYSVPVFPALIAATHVHLNVLDENIFGLLPELYDFESKARELYCRKQTFRGIQSNSHREKFLRTALGPDYKLCDIPSPVPKNIDEYCHLYNSSPKIFPNDTFFPARDVTAIRPTRYGTLEFRSACSFLESDKILDIVDFRIKTFLAAARKFIEK